MFNKNKKNDFDWQELSTEIADGFGGVENIDKHYHCATRLRVIAKDKSKVSLDKLKAIALAKGVNLSGDEFQIIFGAGVVNKVFENFNKAFFAKKEDVKEEKIKTPLWDKKISWYSNLFIILRRAIRAFAEIFVPLIPIFIAGGLSLALTSFFNTINKEGNNQVLKNLSFFFEMIGGAILGSLPAFVGYTAMKKYGGTPILGLAIGVIMVFPGLINGWSSGNDFKSVAIGAQINTAEIGKTLTYSLFPDAPAFFRFDLIGYQAQVFPVLLIVALAYWIERFLKRWTPEALAIIVVPFLTVIGSVFFGFLFVGPTGRYVGIWIGKAINGLYTYTNFKYFGLGGLIIGFIYPFMVVTGLHQGVLPIEALLITQTKADFGHSFTWITPIATVSNISQGMVGLAMIILMFKKSSIGISKAASGALSANLGITEPILFGVTLPTRFGLLAAALASALGSFWLGMTHTVANSQGSASWLGIAVQFDYIVNDNYAHYLNSTGGQDLLPTLAPIAKIAIGAAISTIFSFVFTILLGKTIFKKQLQEFIDQNQNKKKKTVEATTN